MVDREGQTELLGILEPKEQHSGESSGSYFSLIHPRLGAEEAGNLETLGAERKKAKKAHSL